MLRSRDISSRHCSKPLHHRLNLKENGTGTRYLSEVLGEIATFDAPYLVFGYWHALTFISVLFGISCRIILLLCRPSSYLLLYLSLPYRNESHAYILKLNHLSHQKANHFRSAQNHRHPNSYTAYTLLTKPSLILEFNVSGSQRFYLMCLGSSADSPAIRFRISLLIISQHHPYLSFWLFGLEDTLIFGIITLHCGEFHAPRH
jgi:hypothetical protein